MFCILGLPCIALGQSEKLRIHFESDSYELSENEQQRVASLKRKLKQYESIHIMGHTDSDGSDSYNLSLSEKRAETVSRLISSLGYKSEIKTYGENTPLASNGSEEGKRLNRRVEIWLKGKIQPKPKPKRRRDTLAFGDVMATSDNPDMAKWGLKVELITDPVEMLAEDMETLTDDGRPLRSAGVPCVSARRAPLDDKGNFTEPVLVLVPVPESIENPDEYFMWDTTAVASSVLWNNSKEIPIVEQDGRNYYEIPFRRPTCHNIDLPTSDPVNFVETGDYILIRAPRGYRFKDLGYYSKQKSMAFKGVSVNGKSKKMIIRSINGASDLAMDASLQKKRTWFRRGKSANLKSLAISSLPEIDDEKQKAKEALVEEAPDRMYKLNRKVLVENRKNQLVRRTS